MSIFILLFSSIFGFFAFLFFYWKRLREDYDTQLIFTSGILIYLFTCVGGLVGLYFGQKLPTWAFFNPLELWFWSAILLYFFAFLFFLFRGKMSFFEVFEASSIGLIPTYFLFFLSDFFLSRNYFSLGGGLVILVLFSLFLFLDGRYKRFSWYKSGRVGFSGLSVLGILFLLRSVVAILGFSMFSVSGRIDGVISGALAFLMFFSIYNLS